MDGSETSSSRSGVALGDMWRFAQRVMMRRSPLGQRIREHVYRQQSAVSKYRHGRQWQLVVVGRARIRRQRRGIYAQRYQLVGPPLLSIDDIVIAEGQWNYGGDCNGVVVQAQRRTGPCVLRY